MDLCISKFGTRVVQTKKLYSLTMKSDSKSTPRDIFYCALHET